MVVAVLVWYAENTACAVEVDCALLAAWKRLNVTVSLFVLFTPYTFNIVDVASNVINAISSVAVGCSK